LKRHRRRKFCEQCGTKLPSRSKWKRPLVVGIIAMVILYHFRTPDLPTRIRQVESQLATADSLWDAGQKPAAVQKYKEFLRHSEHYQLHAELPAAYRRVIEYEAEHGDGGEARDWIVKAWDEWPGQRMQLSFDSEQAERLWHETTLRQMQR
jgi:hypothetical protein